MKEIIVHAGGEYDRATTLGYEQLKFRNIDGPMGPV